MKEVRLPTVGSLLGAQIGELAQDFLSSRKVSQSNVDRLPLPLRYVIYHNLTPPSISDNDTRPE